jgi:hypothetical protein
LAELQQAGLDAAPGLADDPRLRRVLLRQGTPDDHEHVLRAFTQIQESPP